jgi:Flp pilus assembly protein TadG
VKLFGQSTAMTIREAICRPASDLRRIFARLLSDRRGVGAVEFALIAPLMMIMYFLTVEATQGIEVNKKVGRIASMVADLITQQDTVTAAQLDAIMEIGESTLQPYNRSDPIIVATAIEITPAPNSQVNVLWSRTRTGTACKKFKDDDTKAIVVPPLLNIPGTFLIRVESKLCYTPIIAWAADQEPVLGITSAFSDIAMREVYYLSPRVASTTIPCTGC